MNAVRRVQDLNGLSPEVGTLLIKEIWYQLNKNVLENTENDSRILRPCSKLVTTNVACIPSLSSSSTKNEISLDPLYIITPTYRRPEQIPELTRMSHTLMLVKNIHWLVIEDAYVATKQVTRLLERTGLKFDHLTGEFFVSFQSSFNLRLFMIVKWLFINTKLLYF